ncbi:PSP domain-containing protein [Meloidogyne graminicola]|uniref:PSP domain-containing protein n=1 Tax=Meloidogyne graminicola TaxID=189291 RepID=A0A8S9ZUV3_9BILA|nr:PSP domain-containing protein [Meloidogyne graminicola]
MAALKASTPRPDVVEWADVTSRDPFLLVELKAYRNTVPVPRHWNAKRKYLAGKRGFERPPFELPDFIKRTGIMEMRETMWEKEESQSLKAKMREKTRPKLGRIDIDYQKLHDAFFKWQTKPPMTKMGELYYEGKELEAQMREKKPGQLSDELRIALGMPVGPNANKFPPPWLIAMQRYGPPPSYPTLKIPGLNCPIPEGCAFGYHAGGWGKPPVDEYGKPLYGDVFGLHVTQAPELEDESRVERRHWGEIGSDEEESDEEEDSDLDEESTQQKMVPESGYVTPAPTEGFITPSGITTIPGVETPGSTIELRKKRVGADDTSTITGVDTPAQLYTVLQEKKIERISGQLMPPSMVYDIGASRKMPEPNEGVEVSLQPEELEDQGGLERKYEEQLRKQNRIRMENEEDFSDMVAEHAAKQNRKRKAQEQKKSGTSGGAPSSSSKNTRISSFDIIYWRCYIFGFGIIYFFICGSPVNFYWKLKLNLIICLNS